jgi:hypothetical protein
MHREGIGRLLAVGLLLAAAGVALWLPAPEWWSRNAPNYPPALLSLSLMSAAGIVLLLSGNQGERTPLRLPRSRWFALLWLNGAVFAALSWNPDFYRSVWTSSGHTVNVPVGVWFLSASLFLFFATTYTCLSLMHWAFRLLLHWLGAEAWWEEWWGRFNRA